MQRADHVENGLWLGVPVPFNDAFLKRGEDRFQARLAAGEPEGYLTWEAAVHPRPDQKAAARALLGLE